MESPSAIIFDLDGTLADTSASFIESINFALTKFGHPMLDDETIQKNISGGARGIIRMVEEFTPQQVEEIRDVFIEYYEPIAKQNVIAYGDLVNTIKSLHKEGMKLAVVTNKPEVLAQPVLQQMGILDCFEIVICPEHVKIVKPDPEGILKACTHMQVDPANAIYCGDHRKDIEAAKNAGTKSIAVPFGFVPEHETPETWGADWICQQPEEFDRLLLEFIQEEV